MNVSSIALLVFDWILPLFWRQEPISAPATGAPADPGEEDVIWIRQVAEGNERALRKLFEKWKLPLLSFFYRSLGSHADAEQLTLEVFVRLHRAASDYHPTAKFSTYLFHIARNLARNEARRRRRKPADAAPTELLDLVASATAADARRLAETEELFQQALARLPEKARTALLLVKQQQMDYAEAAATLGMAENALRVLVHRARQLLKKEMEVLS